VQLITNRERIPIPEPVVQLQCQLEQFRSTQPERTELPESLWQATVELADNTGVYPVAHALRPYQRHTAHRIWTRLHEEHPDHPIAEPTVRRYAVSGHQKT
jgi:hypothetical protein